MSNFALITCLNKKEEPEPKRNFLQSIVCFIRKLFMHLKPPPDPDCELITLELYEDLTAFVIKLPYSLNELAELTSSRVEKINRFISHVKEKYEISNMIAPMYILEMHLFHEFTKIPFTPRHLFKCLFQIILDEIFAQKGIKINELDISIIHGENIQELSAFVNLLSIQIKYITVIAKEKGKVEGMLKDIFEDSGLAVRVTSDYKSGIKNADVVVNFSNMNTETIDLKLAPGAVFVNYGEMDVNQVKGDNLIMNGLEVKLPRNILEKFGREVLNYFNSTEIAAIVLSHRTDCWSVVPIDFSMQNMIQTISTDFKKEGYKVSGIQGRRSIIKVKEINF